MKRRAIKSTNKLHDEESRFSKLLFDKSDKLVQNLKPHENNDHEDECSQKPAWVDEDDAKFEANIIPNVKSKDLYVEKLKQKYETLMGTPGWAKLPKNIKNDHSGDDAFLRKVGHLHKGKSSKGIPSGYLQLRKFSKINYTTNCEGPRINCVEFHPKSPMALVAGQSGIVSLFTVDTHTNDKIHSFKLKKWDVSTAYFAPSGNEAYLSTNQCHNYCVYDLVKAEPQLVELPKNIKQAEIFKLSPDGKYIVICDGYDEAFIMSAESRELLKILKHNSKIVSITFSHDSKHLYSFGVHAEVTIWDLSTYKSVKKFYDNGCVSASLITMSQCGRLLATGSGEGIVNVYETASLNIAEPLPYKIISHLKTNITHLKFNPTTEILALASDVLSNATKMIHIPSFHAFTNFPKQDASLGQITTMTYSPNGGYMAIGNNQSDAILYRIHHYKNY